MTRIKLHLRSEGNRELPGLPCEVASPSVPSVGDEIEIFWVEDSSKKVNYKVSRVKSSYSVDKTGDEPTTVTVTLHLAD